MTEAGTGGRNQVVLVVHGPAGAGKDRLIDHLLAVKEIARAVSSTSRPARPEEVEGIHYYFVPGPAPFQRAIETGEFAESFWVHGQGKGLTWAEVRRRLDGGGDFIIKTDVNGARHWREAMTGAVDVLILPAVTSRSLGFHRAVLRARILAREPHIDASELAQRLNDASAEILDAPNADYVIVNRDGGLARAQAELVAILDRERRNLLRPRPAFRV